MDLIERSILASAIMTLMLASAMPLLLMPTLQPVEGQFLGDDDSALLGFDDTTTTNNERLQLDLSAASNNNNTLLRENVKNIRFYAVPLLREAIEDRVGEGNADDVRIVIVGFDGSTHTTVGTNDTVSLIRSEFNSLPKASGNSTGFEITLDSSQCSSPSPNVANAGECQFTIRLAHKAYEAAGGTTTIRPPEESGTIGLNDESEQNGNSNNNDDNSNDSSSSSSISSSNDKNSENEYFNVCIVIAPDVLH